MFGEASSENFAGMVAAANVIRNRLNGPGEFRNLSSYDKIITHSQFNAVGGKQWNRAMSQMRTGRGLLPGDQQAYAMAIAAAEGVANGSIQDNTGGSTWFATPGNHGKEVKKCVASGKCETVDVDGDRNQHEYVRYSKKPG